MTLRQPDKRDYQWMLPSFTTAYSGTGVVWDEDAIERKLQQESGKQLVDDVNFIYGTMEAYEIPHGIFVSREFPNGVIPPGLSTQVKDLIPQHHNQEHVDGKIIPVLAALCRAVAADNPAALDRHVWAFLSYDLAVPYWQDSIFEFKIKRSRGRGNALLYAETLREIINTAEVAGL